MLRINSMHLRCVVLMIVFSAFGNAYSSDLYPISSEPAPVPQQSGDKYVDETGSIVNPPYDRVFAIITGVDTYEDKETKPLSSCFNDAKAVSHLFRSMRIESRKDHCIEFLDNSNATSEKIATILSDWEKSGDGSDQSQNSAEIPGPNDLVVFYFSGHGVSAKPENVSNSPGLQFYNGVIEAHQLIPYLKSIEAKHFLIILDSCFANQFGEHFEKEWGKTSGGEYAWTIFSPVSKQPEDAPLSRSSVPVFENQSSSYYTLALVYGLLGDSSEGMNGDSDGYLYADRLNEYIAKKTEKWLEDSRLTSHSPTKKILNPTVFGRKDGVIVGRQAIPPDEAHIIPQMTGNSAHFEIHFVDKSAKLLKYRMYRLIPERRSATDTDMTGIFVSKQVSDRCRNTRYGVIIDPFMSFHDEDRNLFTLKFSLSESGDDRYLLQLRNPPYEIDEFVYEFPKPGEIIRIDHERKRVKGFRDEWLGEAEIESAW